tara:strand:- start:110 stop:1294 length:1185 start_codon:yes stop_codon:yes gene_type:complete
MENNNDYYKHVINKPDKISFTNKYPDILIINSSDRNKFLYPNSNNFSLGFNNTFNDVVEIELINAFFKFRNYLFNSNNNKIYVDNLTEVIDLDIPYGNYTTSNITETFNKIYLGKKEFKVMNFNLQLQYNVIKNQFYFINISNMDEFKIKYKGNEKKYPSGLFGDPHSNTLVYDYKLKSDGSILGYSSNNFSNKINPISLEVDLIDSSINKYKLIITFSNTVDSKKLENILSLFEPLHKIKFTNSSNQSHIISDTDINGFIRINNSVEIVVTLQSSTLEETINLPEIFTNIVIGDIVANLNSPDFVLLDIEQCNRIKSNNTEMDGSYLQIPINNRISFDVYHLPGSLKHFNPPLRKLDRFHIKIKNKDGTILDENGTNFTLVFGIRTLNNNHIY